MKRSGAARAITRGRPCGLLAAASLLVCVAASPAICEDRKSNHARLHFELSQSTDKSKEHNAGRIGWGFDGGVATRGIGALFLNAGFEHYPAGIGAEIARYPGSGGGMARRSGGGDQTRVTATGGIRVAVPIRGVEPFIELGFGMWSMTGRSPRYSDVSTGAVLIPERPIEQNTGAGEVGFGIRTRRSTGYDGYVGFRSRQRLDSVQSSGDDSYQIRFGVLSP